LDKNKCGCKKEIVWNVFESKRAFLDSACEIFELGKNCDKRNCKNRTFLKNPGSKNTFFDG
jgi:hypothetical protein